MVGLEVGEFALGVVAMGEGASSAELVGEGLRSLRSSDSVKPPTRTIISSDLSSQSSSFHSYVPEDASAISRDRRDVARESR